MTEMVIQQLLFPGDGGRARDLVMVEPHGLEVAADWRTLASPETYLGYRQGRGFAQADRARFDAPAAYVVPDRLELNEWALSGTWNVAGHAGISIEPNARIWFRFHARDVNLVMGPATDEASIPFRVFVDGELAMPSHGTDVDAAGAGVVREQRTYQLLRQSGEISDRLLEVEFLEPGVEVYCFTFG